jgi:hypothetical protein
MPNPPLSKKFILFSHLGTHLNLSNDHGKVHRIKDVMLGWRGMDLFIWQLKIRG